MRLLYYISLVSILLIFIFLIFISSLKSTVFDVSFSSKYNISMTTPQGWGFFTRNPREAQFVLYELEDSVPELVTFKNASSKNLFGFSRLSRRINLEFQRMLGRVNDSLWKEEISELDTLIIEKTGEFIYLEKGYYLIENKETTPWQYAGYKDNYSPEVKYAKVFLDEK